MAATLEGEDDDEGDWYDTASLEPVGEALGGTQDEEALDAIAGPAEMERPDDQPGLFAGTTVEADWLGDDEDEAERPSDEELEEAAAHFAAPAAEGEEAPRVVQIDEENASDLMEELGAEPFPLDEDDDEDEGAFDEIEGIEGEPRSVVVGAEGLGGPSWQEPASVEVGADLDRRGTERDVPAAFLTGIVLAGVALVALLIGDAVFAVVAGLVALVAQAELRRDGQASPPARHRGGARERRARARRRLLPRRGRADGDALARHPRDVPVVPDRPRAASQGRRREHRADAAGAVLDPGPRRFAVDHPHRIRDLGRRCGDRADVRLRHRRVRDRGRWGGSFVQRPLAPATSPKKSIEGLVIASLATIAVSVGFVTALVDAGPGMFTDSKLNALWLGVVVSLAATFGDLAESLIKRDLSVKDMGSVLPGHGASSTDRFAAVRRACGAVVAADHRVLTKSRSHCLFPCGRG